MGGRSYWDSDDRIAQAISALRDSESVLDAVEKLSFDVTYNGLKHAFKSRGMESPSSYLRRPALPTPAVGFSPESQPQNTVVPAGKWASCSSFVQGPASRRELPPFLDAPKPQRDYERNGHTIIIPDVHVPFHDNGAWEVCLAAIERLKPETVVFIGDFLDCYAITFFDKSPDRHLSLKDELDEANPEIRRVRDLAPGRLVFTQGNHEYRFDRYLRKHPELFGLVSLRESLFRGVNDIEWVPYQEDITIGKVLYTHEVGHCGVNAARATLLSCGHNVVFGHTHRGAVVTDGDLTGDRRFALNVGWLGDLKQIDYMHRAKTKDWTHGFGHIFTDHDTGLVWPSFVPIMNGRACVSGLKIAA